MGVIYNHLTINDLQGVAAPTPSGRYSMESVTAPTLTVTNNLSLQSPGGGACLLYIRTNGLEAFAEGMPTEAQTIRKR